MKDCNSMTYKEKEHRTYHIFKIFAMISILIHAPSKSNEKIRSYFQCEKLLKLFKAG